MSNITLFKQFLDKPAVLNELTAGLPAHIKPERFKRVLQTSVANDHRLLKCEPAKIVKAAMGIAALGLVTDGFLGEAYLIADGRNEVQSRIGYRGLIKLARQSGEIASLYASDVCQNDIFVQHRGTDPRLEHTPPIQNRGNVIAYYAAVKYKDGSTDFEVMTKTEIDEIRDKTSDGYKAFKANKIKSTPWDTSYGEMAKKTVLRRIAKRLPMSADLADAIANESRIDDDERRFAEATDITPKPVVNPTALVEVMTPAGEMVKVAPMEVASTLHDMAQDVDPSDRDAWEAHNKLLVSVQEWGAIALMLPANEPAAPVETPSNGKAWPIYDDNGECIAEDCQDVWTFGKNLQANTAGRDMAAYVKANYDCIDAALADLKGLSLYEDETTSTDAKAMFDKLNKLAKKGE